MTIGNINSATSASNPLTALRNALQKVSNSSGSSATQTPSQELMETTAQTKAEAAKGDQQARLKLAQEQAAQPAQQPAAESGEQNSLNAVA